MRYKYTHLPKINLNRNIYQNPTLLSFLTWAVSRTAESEKVISVGKWKVRIRKNHFLFDPRQAQRDTGMDSGTVVDLVRRLIDRGVVEVTGKCPEGKMFILRWNCKNLTNSKAFAGV